MSVPYAGSHAAVTGLSLVTPAGVGARFSAEPADLLHAASDRLDTASGWATAHQSTAG